MADIMRTCANCGNAQATGDFCEKCGTRMPAAAAAAAAARPSSPPPSAPPPYGAQTQHGDSPQYGGPPRYNYPEERGFFGRLFDFSFKEFITPSIIKVLFIISIVVIGLSWLAGVILGFMASAGLGVGYLIGGLIGAFLAILYVRVLLEVFVVFFRIHDATREIAKSKR